MTCTSHVPLLLLALTPLWAHTAYHFSTQDPSHSLNSRRTNTHPGQSHHTRRPPRIPQVTHHHSSLPERPNLRHLLLWQLLASLVLSTRKQTSARRAHHLATRHPCRGVMMEGQKPIIPSNTMTKREMVGEVREGTIGKKRRAAFGPETLFLRKRATVRGIRARPGM
jgi:hypothetical protein